MPLKPGSSVQMDLGVADVHTPSAGVKMVPAALAIVRDKDGRVLTVSRPEPPHEMSIPGGMVDDGETPEQAAIRELAEETGVQISNLTHVHALASPLDGRPVHVFRAGAFSGTASAREPNTKVAWMYPGELLVQSANYKASLRELMSMGALSDKQESLNLSISAAKRDSLSKTQFALPSKRKYPLDTAARTRNAAARLEQMKKRGKVSDAEYSQAKGRIAKAAKKYGIESEYNASDDGASGDTPLKRRSIHVRADLAPGGALHVRHNMSDRAFYDAEGVTLASDATAGDKPVWIQIAKSGAFAGHPAGPFELNVKTFSEIVDNFKSTKNRAIPVDYEHASEQEPTSGSIPINGAPAQGWILDLRIDDGNLWGLVEWLPQARDQIRSGGYRFLSPAIRFGSKDRVTGKPVGARLTSAALTNEPFLDGMQPLAAKDEPQAVAVDLVSKNPGTLVHAASHYMPKIRAALRVHDLTSAADCSDTLDRLRDMCMTAGYGGVHEGVSLAEFTGPLADLVGATPGMTWDDVFDRVQDMIDQEMDAHIVADHGGQTSMTDTAPNSNATEGATGDPVEHEDTEMADETHAIALKDAQTKVSELATQLKDANEKAVALETKATEIGAQLKAETARADAAASAIKELSVLVALKDGDTLAVGIKKISDELKLLRDEKTAREEADVKADVESAFDTYKDVKQLTDKDKEHMLSVRKEAPSAFNGLYPPIAPSQRHLLRKVVPTEKRPEGDDTESFSGLTKKLMSEEKLSLADAQIEAARRLGRKGRK